MALHVGTQNGVDAGLVSAFATEPAEQVSVEAHGHDLFGHRHYDFGGFPELNVGGASIRISGQSFTNRATVRSAQARPVRGRGALRSYSFLP